MFRKSFFAYLLGITALHLIITLPLLTRPPVIESDEILYHYPSILRIRAHWPNLDFINDVLSAVSPAYHYFLATVSLITVPELVSLRIVNDIVSLFIPLTLFCWLACWLKPRRAFWLVLPVLFSSHFIKDSCVIMTDNASILLIEITLACVFLLPARGEPGILAGIVATAAVAVRQLALWLEAPLLLQPLLEYVLPHKGNPKQRPMLLDFFPWSIRLLPLGVVAFLYSQWHGLVPPAWQSTMVTLSAAPAAFILSLAALFGIPFLLCLGPLLRRDLIISRWTACAALIGLMLVCLSPNYWSLEKGHWGAWFGPSSAGCPSLEIVLFSS